MRHIKSDRSYFLEIKIEKGRRQYTTRDMYETPAFETSTWEEGAKNKAGIQL